MRLTSAVARLLRVEDTIVEDVEFGDETLIVHVRPGWRKRDRCGLFQRRSPSYDDGSGPRRWRGRDFGATKVFLEADAPRVECVSHGVVTASVPWARHEAVVKRRCKRAKLCMHPFHVVAWATRALGEVRREAWNEVRRQGMLATARELKIAMPMPALGGLGGSKPSPGTSSESGP